MRVIDAGDDFVVSETEVAVSVTLAALGSDAGAVYVMGAPEALEVAERAPHVAPLHAAPESVQVTP